MKTLVPGPDGWWLAPEAAVVHPVEGTAVIADVHLGYEWSRGRGGDIVPAHSLKETLCRLDSLLRHCQITTLVVAGDLVESSRLCQRTARDLGALEGWLSARGVALVRVLGNHDGEGTHKHPLTVEVGGWTIGHGHLPITAARTISGHDHPVIRLGRTLARCWLVGPSQVVLPAFSDNAAGLNVAQPPIPARWRGRSLRCWAATGERLLDFGMLDQLHSRLALASPT